MSKQYFLVRKLGLSKEVVSLRKLAWWSLLSVICRHCVPARRVCWLACVVLVCASCSPVDYDVAFQSCRTLQGAGVALAFALSSGMVCITAKLYITVVLLVLAVVFYAVFEYRLRRSAAAAAARTEDDDDHSAGRRRTSSDYIQHGCDFTWSSLHTQTHTRTYSGLYREMTTITTLQYQ